MGLLCLSLKHVNTSKKNLSCMYLIHLRACLKHENDPLHQAGSGQFKDTSFTSVKKLLSEFEGVQVIKGDATKTVEGIFEEVPRGLDFLHLDTDVYPNLISSRSCFYKN